MYYNKTECSKKNILEAPPKVLNKPCFLQYGLDENIIKKNIEYKKELKREYNLFYMMFVCCLFLIGYFFNNDMLHLVMFPIVMILFVKWVEGRDRIETDIDKKLREYEYDNYCYKWWTELYPQKRVSAYWFSLNGYEFEKSLAEVFSANGYYVNITQKSNDGGVDIILNKDSNIVYVQCKAFKGKAGVAIVRELYGVMQSNKISFGIVACLGGFTKGASDFAFGKNIRLIDVNDIIKMVQNGI